MDGPVSDVRSLREPAGFSSKSVERNSGERRLRSSSTVPGYEMMLAPEREKYANAEATRTRSSSLQRQRLFRESHRRPFEQLGGSAASSDHSSLVAGFGGQKALLQFGTTA